MNIEQLIQEINDFQGTAIEYLEFEVKIRKELDSLSDEDNEYLMDSEVMEPISMICEGIRYEVSRYQNASLEEKSEMLKSETGDILKQVLEYLGIGGEADG